MRYIFLSALMVFGLSVVTAAESTGAVDASVREAFKRARTERVAVVAIGDSNQCFGGHGWTAALGRALSEEFGCYGTELVRFQHDSKTDDAVPEEFLPLSLGAWYLPAGKAEKPFWRNGQMIIPAEHPLGVAGALRFHLWHGTVPDGSEISPTVRRDQAPWTTLIKSEPFSTAAASIELRSIHLDLPADSGRTYPVLFSVVPKNQEIKGAFLGSALLAENIDKKSGISFNTLYARGGQSLYDMLNTIREEWTEKRVSAYFAQIRQALDGNKHCIVIITSGLNDRNEKSRSLGPVGGLMGSSPEAFADNLEGLAQALTAAWESAGGSADTLTLVFMPSHPVEVKQGQSDLLEQYRNMAVRVAAAAPNRGCIMISKLVTQKPMAESGYYDKEVNSSPHLSRKGYEAIAALITEAIAGKQ